VDSLDRECGVRKETEMSQAEIDVLAERQRQIHAEGWDEAHDDKHDGGELAIAGACYALGPNYVHIPRQINSSRGAGDCYQYDYTKARAEQITWPWEPKWWKPGKDERRRLVKAAALIIAEIDRVDREAAR
jgi:hypothetical protein